MIDMYLLCNILGRRYGWGVGFSTTYLVHDLGISKGTCVHLIHVGREG